MSQERIFLEGLFQSAQRGRAGVSSYLDNHILTDDADCCRKLLTQCCKLYNDKISAIERKEGGYVTVLHQNMETIATELIWYPRGSLRTQFELSILLFCLVLSVLHFEERMSLWWAAATSIWEWRM